MTIEEMEWHRILNALSIDRGWTPEQIFNIAVATFWLMFKLTENRRPHDSRRLRDWWNKKFRISQGLAPIVFRDK